VYVCVCVRARAGGWGGTMTHVIIIVFLVHATKFVAIA
jgi:hypothetical protein